MRNILLLFGILVLAACNKERVRITGHLANADKKVLHLDEVDVYENRTEDSVVLKKDGSFRFTFDTKGPCFYQLRLADNQVIVLFPKPGEHININADAGNLLTSLRIKGSNDTEQVTTLIHALHDAKSRLDSIGTLYEKATEDSVKDRLSEEYQDIMDSHRKFSIAFILTHYNSLASLYALYQQYQPGTYVFYKATDMQFFKIVSDSLSKYIPDSKHVVALKAHTNKMLGDYQAQLLIQKAGNLEAGLPDVSLPNLQGDTVSLRSLKGRYVLLSFWASADQSSVDQNLAFKKIYNRYKDQGLEIFQVSFDRSAETWKRAVRFDELPWISVHDSEFPNSMVAASYNITQIPSNYLIDKDNVTILAKNLTPAQLQLKLDELIK
jgi:peroxiredoxin